MIDLDSLLTAALEDLFHWTIESTLDDNLCPDVRLYTAYSRTLLSYFRSDLPELLRIATSHNQPEILKSLTQIRYYHRRGNLTVAEVEICENLKQSEDQNKDWIKAEILFVLASIHYNRSNFSKAIGYFQEAISFYQLSGCIKKSVRSQLNLLACMTCENIELKLIPDYLRLAQQALTIGEFVTAATCLINISRELQRMKAYNASLEKVKGAIDLLEQNKLYFRELGLSYVQAADVLFDQKRNKEALIYVEKSLLIPNEFVHGALKVLIKKHKFEYLIDEKFQLLPTWQERLAIHSEPAEPQSEIKLGEMEEKLIRLLSTGAKNKFELIEKLFPDSIDLNSKDERLKNLISRVRRKIPDTLIFLDNSYQLVGNETF